MPPTNQKSRLKTTKLYMQSYSICQFSRITLIHKASLTRVFFRFEERGSLEHHKSPGRPKKINYQKFEKKSCPGLKKRPFLYATYLQ